MTSGPESNLKSLMEYVVSSKTDRFPKDDDFLFIGFLPALKPDLEKRGISLYVVQLVLIACNHNN
jgi:hypothetical protein